MITFRKIPDSNIVEFTVDGDVTQDDYDAVIREVDAVIADYGSVDLLEEVRDIGRIPLSVFRDDLKWVMKHWKQIGRTAVVCDKRWIEALLAVMRPMVSTELRHFDLDSIDEARAWLRDARN